MLRRQFIKYSSIGTIMTLVLAHNVPSYLLNEDVPLLDYSTLSANQQKVLYLLIPTVTGIKMNHQLILLLMQRIEDFFITLPIDRKSELEQLFSLFDAGLFTKGLTKTPLQFKSEKDIIKLLENWKVEFDHFVLNNQLYVAYKSLCDLVFMGFYSTKQGHDIAKYQSFYARL